ncbi:ComF family protein [Novosphingobium sp. 9]|uniref:ComF family protein n=1 Tax=Novosphingobium sp. 9 TaxID=2025349 RepID=UPI0021B5CF61|nr:ComF family protein [Novosphingobium sp. 9]
MLWQSIAPVVDLVFPPRCPICGDAIAVQNGLCSACWSGMVVPGEPACALCRRPFSSDIEHGAICAPCLAEPPRHDGIFAATLYNDPSRKLVLALKHGGKIAMAGMLAGQMAARVPHVGPGWLVVPVPLHRWRLWQRGYNQAVELGRCVARERDARLIVDALERHKRTPSLGGLGRKARERALSGAITVNPRRKDMLRGAQVLLVDDVLTSGATSNACVSALKRAGAKAVAISCYARVLDEGLPG